MENLILQALSAFEAGLPGKRPINQLYIHHYSWMVSALFIKRMVGCLFALTRPQIPGLQFKHVSGLIINWLKQRGARSDLASAADAIQLKHDHTRLRAFFLSSINLNANNSWCLKIVSKNHEISHRTRNELITRKALENLNSISIPKIIYTSEDESFIYIVEELVKGRRFNMRQDWKLFKLQGINELCNTYKLNGVQFEPLKMYLPEYLLNNIMPAVRQLRDGNIFLHHLQEAYNSNTLIPVSLCHSDLLPSNLAVSNGRLYFFDWEKSGRGPIFHDLMKLPMKYPTISRKLVEAVIKIMKREFSMENMGLKFQLTAYVALRIYNKPDMAAIYLKIWRYHLSNC